LRGAADASSGGVMRVSPHPWRALKAFPPWLVNFNMFYDAMHPPFSMAVLCAVGPWVA
jgi:hypothetical protein